MLPIFTYNSHNIIFIFLSKTEFILYYANISIFFVYHTLIENRFFLYSEIISILEKYFLLFNIKMDLRKYPHLSFTFLIFFVQNWITQIIR